MAPDGHGQQCYRVRIQCGSGRILRPIIAAESPTLAREKAMILATELCRVTLPWLEGEKDQRADEQEPIVGDARRAHRWWTA